MATAYKSLQANPSAATLTDIYTVPSATTAIVANVTVCNRSAVPTSFRIALRKAGASIDDAHYRGKDTEILGNDIFVYNGPINMETTDVLSVYATLATLSFGIDYAEMT